MPYLVVFGIAGVAFVQWLYFVAIARLPIGIALLLEYIGPILIAIWAWAVFKEPVRRRIWAALVLALAGLSLVVEVWTVSRSTGSASPPPSAPRSRTPSTC